MEILFQILEKLQIFLEILKCCLIVAVLDYLLYNLTKHLDWLLKIYRVFHGILVLYLGYHLFLKFGIVSPFLFWAMCWGFNNDWLYYFIGWILNLKKPPFAQEGRGTAEMYFKARSVAHAWWTPIGLAFNLIDIELPFEMREKPSAAALWVQSGIIFLAVFYISVFLL